MFVQVTKAKGIGSETFHRLREAWIGDGLAGGMLFLVAGPGDDAWYVVEGWRSREDCEAALAAFIGAVREVGIEAPELIEEEFDLDYQRFGSLEEFAAVR